MVHTLASRALLVVIGMSLTVNAVSFENFIDPLLKNGGDEELEQQLTELGRVVVEEARALFNFTFGASTLLTYQNALIVMIGISALVLGLFFVSAKATESLFLGSGTSVQSYYGKRSLPDGEEEGLDFNWIRIMQILHQMDEHFRRLGAEKSENDCRKRIICKLSEKSKSDIVNLDKNQQKLVKLTNELSGIYENNKLDTSERLDLKTAYKNVKAYHEANNHGRKHGKCNVSFPNCDSV